MTEEKKNKSKWGIGIALLYGGFVVFMLTIVIFSTMQDFSLVEDNYYQKSLSYQTKIDNMKNTEKLSVKPFVKINSNEKSLTVTFPDSVAKNGISGTLLFFRPSDKRADQMVPIDLNSSNQMILSTTRFLKGYWVMKLSWESEGTSYYQEENLTI